MSANSLTLSVSRGSRNFLGSNNSGVAVSGAQEMKTRLRAPKWAIALNLGFNAE